MDVNVFNALKKDNVRYVRMRDTKKCVTRSKCVTSSGILRVKGIPHDVFVKVSPCMYGRIVADTKRKARQTPQYIETRMMKITNRLNTKNVCRSIVYCYNTKALKKNLVNVKGFGFQSIIVTENVRGYMGFDDFLERRNYDAIASVLFQLVYTLQCMNTIRLTHTDLHFGNMFVRHRPELEGYYDTYEFRFNKGYHKVKIPCTYQLKIIDFDGAHKGEITGIRQLQIYDPMFTKGIKNKLLPWGNPKVVNVRFDIMKVMFHLYDTMPRSEKLRKLLVLLGFVNTRKKVPYYDFKPNKDFPTRNINGANNYGMFYNENGDFLQLTDKHIQRPKDIIAQCAIYMHRIDKDKKKKEFDIFSQRGLGLRV